MAIIDQRPDESTQPTNFQPMPAALMAAIYPYDADTRSRVSISWSGLAESERQQYREFVAGRLWPSRTKRCKIAAARLVQIGRQLANAHMEVRPVD